MTKVYSKGGFEIWAQYDHTADVYELFYSPDGDDYCGCVDTMAEARKLAQKIVAERIQEG